MSRTLVLIAALSILELSICANASISENSSDSSVPANSESISEAAEAEQPARLIEESAAPLAKSLLPEGSDAAKPKKSSQAKAAAKLELPEDDELDKPRKLMADEKEQDANAYMAQDDSNPGASDKDPVLFYQAGCRFMNQKKFQMALDSFNKALELNPRYYEASFRKALVYQLTGYDKYAARRYQDVLKYRPDMLEARINLATLHRKHKHYSGAEEELREVIRRNCYSFDAHYNLANVLVEAGKPEEALQEYKFCLKLKPKNAMVHNNLGVLFLERKYPDEALQEFRTAARLAPSNPTFQKNMQTAQQQIAAKKAKGSTM